MHEHPVDPAHKPIVVKNILIGVGCALAVAGSGALYQLHGLTPKVVSFVIGYWGLLPFVYHFTGHGFGFKKKPPDQVQIECPPNNE
ncbi:hypothetical protein C1X34_30845 [Pseudomonas sp. GW456-12-10-14-TSB6]|nr:hypothetical protein C1X55_29720 [Pseudomonas sp. GW460-C8]PMW10547.1 hypothetical protein C1X40_30290 [Pseudomonas sp. GW456-11-11-14-TSB2]PMW12510.1 hypothetical protein C1X53_30760 [Pseudomonas sp. GW456-E6]PMW28814.1 hypothetical protein C1X45_30275 [Pseudomonas sp. GW460-7]PMW41269.1 hypothetical protein C1X48_07450 [Pseudomonas sp. FW305-3-2-15-A-R2A1]PMW57820.1 hypothetical protein C1X31_24680 [Pseudomonas sp. GW456-11-11-14-LB2]PMW62861.1 hypothetical protein C1X39_04435 [Pseudomon